MQASIILCISQARINWEGCGRKGIRQKMGVMMEVVALIAHMWWLLDGFRWICLLLCFCSIKYRWRTVYRLVHCLSRLSHRIVHRQANRAHKLISRWELRPTDWPDSELLCVSIEKVCANLFSQRYSLIIKKWNISDFSDISDGELISAPIVPKWSSLFVGWIYFFFVKLVKTTMKIRNIPVPYQVLVVYSWFIITLCQC